jgi:hypothetical protein
MLRDEHGDRDQDGQREEQDGTPDAAAPWRKIPGIIGPAIYTQNKPSRRLFTPSSGGRRKATLRNQADQVRALAAEGVSKAESARKVDATGRVYRVLAASRACCGSGERLSEPVKLFLKCFRRVIRHEVNGQGDFVSVLSAVEPLNRISIAIEPLTPSRLRTAPPPAEP